MNRMPLAAALASARAEAEMRLGEFEAKWDADYLPIG